MMELGMLKESLSNIYKDYKVTKFESKYGYLIGLEMVNGYKKIIIVPFDNEYYIEILNHDNWNYINSKMVCSKVGFIYLFLDMIIKGNNYVQ